MTESDVAYLRGLDRRTVNYSAEGKRLKVSATTIRRIVRRETWKHVACDGARRLKYKPMNAVRLKNRTECYRVHVYNGTTIFVGTISGQVTDESNDVVVAVF